VRFSDRVILRAMGRQDRHNGLGAVCARCSKNLFKQQWYAVLRIPIEQGGRYTIENCVILCSKCYEKVGKTNMEIPYSILPFFEV